MKNIFILKSVLFKNFNNQNIHIHVIGTDTLNFLIENASIEIKKNVINFYEQNKLKLSINLKDILKFKLSHFQIIFYFSGKQIELEI